MAEIQITQEQQQQLNSLAKMLANDPEMRTRFQQDVRSVLAEYGLSGILTEGVQYMAELGEAEVSGYALSNDRSHIDGHLDVTHMDHPHADVTAATFAGFQIMPTLPKFGAF